MTYHDPKSSADIENRFSFHPASTSDVAAQHEKVRASCKALGHQLDADLPPGREKALALTKLEEAMFWANAAIARPGAGNGVRVGTAVENRHGDINAPGKLAEHHPTD
ncbi:DUF7681 family protein [Mycolicibacterium sphagni]|uniref:Acb2/Tad1 domain-containing protein n=1 Tax=Mycolicibacterium sphagni TaxID=1786 RepID=UPI001A9C88FC|nr:hypothetical protein [Mycolicibacterium sphagni]